MPVFTVDTHLFRELATTLSGGILLRDRTGEKRLRR